MVGSGDTKFALQQVLRSIRKLRGQNWRVTKIGVGTSFFRSIQEGEIFTHVRKMLTVPAM